MCRRVGGDGASSSGDDDNGGSPFAVSNVFVTFETETEQREALTSLSVRRWDVWTNNKEAMRWGGGGGERRLFRGDKILSVREPPEPGAVRWHDLDETVLVSSTDVASFSPSSFWGGEQWR